MHCTLRYGESGPLTALSPQAQRNRTTAKSKEETDTINGVCHHRRHPSACHHDMNNTREAVARPVAKAGEHVRVALWVTAFHLSTERLRGRVSSLRGPMNERVRETMRVKQKQ